jgi:hypothetical protein
MQHDFTATVAIGPASRIRSRFLGCREHVSCNAVN